MTNSSERGSHQKQQGTTSQTKRPTAQDGKKEKNGQQQKGKEGMKPRDMQRIRSGGQMEIDGPSNGDDYEKSRKSKGNNRHAVNERSSEWRDGKKPGS